MRQACKNSACKSKSQERKPIHMHLLSIRSRHPSIRTRRYGGRTIDHPPYHTHTLLPYRHSCCELSGAKNLLFFLRKRAEKKQSHGTLTHTRAHVQRTVEGCQVVEVFALHLLYVPRTLPFGCFSSLPRAHESHTLTGFLGVDPEMCPSVSLISYLDQIWVFIVRQRAGLFCCF